MKQPILTTADLYMGPIGLMVAIVLCYYLVMRSLSSKGEKDILWISFGIKAVMVVLSALMYQYYYAYGDTFRYYQCATELNRILYSDPSTWLQIAITPPSEYSLELRQVTEFRYYRSFTTRWVNIVYSVLLIPGAHSYLWLAFLSQVMVFIGLKQMSDFAIKFFADRKLLLRGIFFLVPSLLFWSSGVMKEPIVLWSLGGIFYLLSHRLRSVVGWIWLGVSCFLLLHLKAYILASMITAGAITLLLRRESRKHIYRWGIPFLLFVIVLYREGGAQIQRYLSIRFLESRLIDLQDSQILHTDLASGSGYSIEQFTISDPVQMILSSLSALHYSALRPYVWEAKKAINLLAVFENSLFVALVVYLIVQARKIKLTVRQSEFMVFATVWTVLLFVIVGLTSFNYGTLSRYRIICLPYFVMILMLPLLGDKHSRTGRALPHMTSQK